ncbi:MAG: hypothetical protein AAGD01_10585 [Acidobacteriota bacterium]
MYRNPGETRDRNLITVGAALLGVFDDAPRLKDRVFRDLTILHRSSALTVIDALRNQVKPSGLSRHRRQ